MSHRRAGVLIGVQLLIGVHIAYWLWTGSAVSPLEPSEAMEFSKHGLVNAGFVLFSIAILATLITGRYFCGWGCHLLALQDLCRWLLGKVGLRPRPLRSRVLMTVPLLAFLYMFVWPVVARVWHLGTIGSVRIELTRGGFWDTFPGWAVGSLTFLVCGFLIVYLLGSKAFCTYACPYGGIFVVVDRLAPLRIRVTDACQHCGHCTAACTSNVRVHEEVRDFGCVVDPGCMKCMDCVSVCPNDALYLGAGRPAILTPRRRAGADRAGTADRAGASGGSSAGASAGAFVGSSGGASVGSLAGSSAGSSAGASGGSPGASGKVYVLRSASEPPRGATGSSHSAPRRSHRASGVPSWGEECFLGGVFLATLAIIHGLAPGGLYGVFPFLLSLGVSVIVAFLALQGLRLGTRSNVKIQNRALKVGGRLTGTGWVYVVFLVGLLAGLAHGGQIRYHVFLRDRAYARLKALPALPALPAGRASVGTESPADATDTDAIPSRLVETAWAHAVAIDAYRWLSAPDNDFKLADLSFYRGDLDGMERFMRRAMAGADDDLAYRLEFARLMVLTGRPDDAMASVRPIDTARSRQLGRWITGRYGALAVVMAMAGRIDDALEVLDQYHRVDPSGDQPWLRVGRQLARARRWSDAERVYRHGIERLPQSARLPHDAGVLAGSRGDLPGAIERFRAALRLDPAFPRTRLLLAQALIGIGRVGDAIGELNQSLVLNPDQADAHVLLGRALVETGSTAQAEPHFRRAVELDPDNATFCMTLSQFLDAIGRRDQARYYKARAMKLAGEADSGNRDR